MLTLILAIATSLFKTVTIIILYHTSTNDKTVFPTVRKEVNPLFIAIVSIIVVVFISIPIITYTCIKCFEWIDNR